MIFSPLEQFQVYKLINFGIGDYDLSLTNSSLNLLLVLFFIYIVIYNFKFSLIGNNWQVLLEFIYNFVISIINEQVGKKGIIYLPLFLSLFLFLLFSNLLGMIPYTLTITSQPIITLGLSFTLIIGLTIIGLSIHGFHFFHLFMPHGVSPALLFLVVPLELLGYFIRPISLGVRLFANMFAGHTLLGIVAFFTWNIIIYGGVLGILGILPIFLIFILIILELTICLLQAYVFTLLFASYMNDVINLH